MAFNAKALLPVAIVATSLRFLLLLSFSVSAAHYSDFYCLKSMKESLQDPQNFLSLSWNFDNGSICNFYGISCWNDSEDRVLYISMTEMGLRGQFPRGLGNCTSLTGLNLSNNELSGPIPSDIGQTLHFLATLDLSNNRFSGLIPPSIANCNFLNILKLENNRLWGPIPGEIGLMDRLEVFSVADNSLTGPVPTFIKSIPYETNYANNVGLCGLPLEPCEDSSASGISNRVLFNLFFSGFMTAWAIATSLVLFVCLSNKPEIALKKLTTKKKNKKKKLHIEERSQSLRGIEINNNHKIAKLEKYVSRLSFAELSDATSNFSQNSLIGTGKKGTVYKAAIPNGWFLAIKRLFHPDQLDRQLAAEVSTLGKLRHCRLVPLLGFCIEKNDMFLVYKYMSNGNLYSWLHTETVEREVMEHYWPLRVKVAVGVAEGLAWLHHFGIVHGTISSNSILLDESFEPKISNFWEAKFLKSGDQISNWSFSVAADSLELDSNKQDVYWFGIMLLELITRKQPRQLASFIENLQDTSLSYMLSNLLTVDPILIGQGFDDEILQCLELAKKCALSKPDQRPPMLQVYENLAALTKVYNNAGASEMSG